MIRKILISQPRPATERNPYTEMEAQFGVQFDFRQLIHVEGLCAREFRQQHINPLDYTAVILNSRLGIEHYFRLCEEMRLNVPDTMHYYCISEAVGNYLQKFIQYRKRKVFFSENNRFEDLLPAMHRRPNEKYLMVLSDIHNQNQLDMFAKNNIEVKPAIMYRTVSTQWGTDPFDYDMIALFTPAGAKSIRENFPDFEQENTVIAAFGANTAQALEELGMHADIRVPSPEFQSLTAAIEDYLEKHNG